MSALACYVRLATPCHPLGDSHRLEAAGDSPRHHRQEAAAVQQVESLRLGCNHLLMAVQPHTQKVSPFSSLCLKSCGIGEGSESPSPMTHELTEGEAVL